MDKRTPKSIVPSFHNTKPSGVPLPLSIEEQWKQVDYWHQRLTSDQASDYPTLDSFNEAWEELEAVYQYNGECVVERGAQPRTADTPMAALFYFVEGGFYPPPELLLTLLGCWETYKWNAGGISLEEAFLGPSRKGAGNYAKRKSASFLKMHMQWEFARLLRAGKSRTEIAAELSNQRGGKPDADSILRMFRGFNGFPVQRQKAEK